MAYTYTPTVFREKPISIIRKGIEISVIFKRNVVLNLLIDPHDKRITGCDFDDLLSLSAPERKVIVDQICSYLKENCGGKEFLLLPPEISPLFREYGFVSAYNELSPEKQDGPRRAKFVTATRLANAELKIPDYYLVRQQCNLNQLFNYKLSAADRGVFKSQKERILKLALSSGFSEQKIKDYGKKGSDGMLLAFTDDANLPFALMGAEGEIFACCRITVLGNSFGYLCDTFVDENYLKTALEFDHDYFAKAIGTYLLYQEIGKWLLENPIVPQTLLLIEPPPSKFKFGEKDAVFDRAAEFDSNFGCQPLSELQEVRGGIQALMNFDSPKNDLQQAFDERVESVNRQQAEESSVELVQPAPQKSFA